MKHSGYTLIELLVVLGIVAMLTAVVFGALGPSRERGREAVCLSQMHQWGLAFAMYTQDYEGLTPVKGKMIPPTQLGMPLRPRTLVTLYHLEHMIDCPSVHWPPEKPKREIPLISYEVNFAAPDDAVWQHETAAEIAQDGTQYPILDCTMHNADVDFDHQPTWAKKRLLVLRWDQHLQWETVPVHSGP